MDTELRFSLLGSFEIRVGDRRVPVNSPKYRILLAALLLRPGTAVPVDELAEAVWSDTQPASPRRVLRVMITRVRALLEAAGCPSLIQTIPGGYRADVPDEGVDVARFRRRLREADAGQGDAGAELRALEAALGEWRGNPLEDVPSDLLHRTHTASLTEQLLTCRERRIDARLRLGRPAEVLPELVRLTSEHPLREKPWIQLMTALHDDGRRAEALDAYHRARRVFVDELGIEPGDELRRMQGRVLTGDGGVWPAVPRQLPAELPGFVGRVAEVALLDGELAALNAGPGPGSPGAVAITGTAGVGKSALALHWSRRVADHFPDGQLWIDLRGYDARSRVTPPEALARFLRALGVPGDEIPAEADGRAELYRSTIDGRRMLVVLDNAADDEHARPLLPSGPGSLALVTSRSRMLGLIASGARAVRLDLFSAAEAEDMLSRRLGAGRVRAEPAAVDEIIRRCARLPLALSVVAARAAAQPGFPLDVLAGELSGACGRLDALSGPDAATDVRSVLGWSYRAVSPAAARLFRLLGLHAGPDISLPAAAGLAGVPPARARVLLAELTDAHLVDEHAPGRYAFHDLIRSYAAERLDAEASHGERHAAGLRLLDHYAHTAYPASLLLYRYEDPIPPPRLPPRAGVVPEVITDREHALAWFTAERAVLMRAVRTATEAGFGRHAWRLAWSVNGFLAHQG